MKVAVSLTGKNQTRMIAFKLITLNFYADLLACKHGFRLNISSLQRVFLRPCSRIHGWLVIANRRIRRSIPFDRCVLHAS